MGDRASSPAARGTVLASGADEFFPGGFASTYPNPSDPNIRQRQVNDFMLFLSKTNEGLSEISALRPTQDRSLASFGR
jgi:hypothetical protein